MEIHFKKLMNLNNKLFIIKNLINNKKINKKFFISFNIIKFKFGLITIFK